MGDQELKETFLAFAAYGEKGKKVTEMNNKNFSKLCKECGVFNKDCTSTDADINFSKIKDKGARTINFEQFVKLLNLMAVKRFKGKSESEQAEAVQALVRGKAPGANKATKISKSGGVDRMTDSSKYTGSHKERFDESGKGKGISGREELADNTGYVGNYKGQNTYDKK